MKILYCDTFDGMQDWRLRHVLNLLHTSAVSEQASANQFMPLRVVSFPFHPLDLDWISVSLPVDIQLVLAGKMGINLESMT